MYVAVLRRPRAVQCSASNPLTIRAQLSGPGHSDGGPDVVGRSSVAQWIR